jgi:hypothetical protein
MRLCCFKHQSAQKVVSKLVLQRSARLYHLLPSEVLTGNDVSPDLKTSRRCWGSCRRGRWLRRGMGKRRLHTKNTCTYLAVCPHVRYHLLAHRVESATNSLPA